MVQEEHGVTGRRCHVAGRVASVREVAGAVHAEHVLKEIALQHRGEVVVILVLGDQRPRVAVLGLAARQVRGDVAPDAARVIAEAVAVGHDAGECGRDGAQVLF